MSDSTVELKSQLCLNGKYIIQHTLGVGGFGITYAAYDMEAKRNCAVKELFPQGIVTRTMDGMNVAVVSTDKQETFEHSKERFLEEAEILQSLNPVKEVVSVYDFFMENGTCYFVMEYLEGVTLRKLVKMSGNGLPYDVVMDTVRKLGHALVIVHQHNFFHRDISPDNIIVTGNGEVKLIDFGNAKTLSQDANQKLSVVLKPGFAPLEQYSLHGKQGTYTDVYSLACTIYYMMTAKKIPDALDRTKGKAYQKLKEFGYPAFVSDTIDKALMIKYTERIQTVSTFLKCLGLADDQNIPKDQKAWLTKYVHKVPEPQPSATKRYIQILQVGKAEVKYDLPDNKGITIGRVAQFCDIVVEGDPHISKKHCEVIYDAKGRRFLVLDQSSNGLYINGQKLPHGQPVMIKPGQLIMLGSNSSGFKVGEKV